MDPVNLLLPDGTPSLVWACGACKLVAADESRARKCCVPIPCTHCGEPTESKYRHGYESARHDECERRDRARRDMARIERAEKLETWDGYVWDRGDYHESLEVYVDHLADTLAPADWPEWVHVCKVSHPRIDAGHVLENVLELGWEDMDYDDLNGVKELEAAIEAFNKANESVNVYDADMRRVVRVPRVTADEESASC